MNSLAVLSDQEKFTSIAKIVKAIVKEWPEHEKFIQTSLSACNDDYLVRLENVSKNVLVLANGQLDRFAADYRWTCGVLREEQFYFARNKEYRRSKIDEAIRDVYANDAYMSRYINGLLLSQVIWQNHTQAMDIYRTRFLPNNKNGYDHLEVGPGHGLFLVYAAEDPRCNSIAGWDVSLSSLESTQSALQKMNVKRNVEMLEAEICSVTVEPEQFDSIMCSEVLEHTEQPEKALQNMFQSLRPNGRLFLNIPINSPAPDHIYLWRKPEEIRNMVVDCGYEVEDFIEIAPTGKTLEQAYKQGIDISCVTIARKPNSNKRA